MRQQESEYTTQYHKRSKEVSILRNTNIYSVSKDVNTLRNINIQTAKRIWVLRWRTLEDRPLVEKREEIFALSREEEKAVWAIASSFSLGKKWKF